MDHGKEQFHRVDNPKLSGASGADPPAKLLIVVSILDGMMSGKWEMPS
jgi:hypothetical protein